MSTTDNYARTVTPLADATITVEWDGLTLENRQQYLYIITTPEWEYIGNDLHSGTGAGIDTDRATQDLCAFLSACAESRDHIERGHDTAENTGLFPDHVGEWAQCNSDELAMLSIDDSER